MAYTGSQQPSRKASAPWDRLKPVKQDPLESMGYVSKGDNRLLDSGTQESYYNKIVARYMQFCSQHSKNLDSAFASLSISSEDPATHVSNDYQMEGDVVPGTQSRRKKGLEAVTLPSTELSILLSALRKLREGLLATQAKAPTPVFSQRVHVFNIRLAILALSPASYHPSLLHLLFKLHSAEYPLPISELCEMTSYLILDMATRQQDLASAFALRYNSKMKFGFESRNVNAILRSVVTNNWVAFWRVRRKVDGYFRGVLHWEAERLRKTALKAIGRTYMTCDIQWILHSTSGDELTWDELVNLENVGWIRDREQAIIRKPKLKTGDTVKTSQNYFIPRNELNA